MFYYASVLTEHRRMCLYRGSNTHCPFCLFTRRWLSFSAINIDVFWVKLCMKRLQHLNSTLCCHWIDRFNCKRGFKTLSKEDMADATAKLTESIFFRYTSLLHERDHGNEPNPLVHEMINPCRVQKMQPLSGLKNLEYQVKYVR